MDNSKSLHNKRKKLFITGKLLKARATQGGISEDDLKHYLKDTLKVTERIAWHKSITNKPFNWVNAQLVR